MNDETVSKFSLPRICSRELLEAFWAWQEKLVDVSFIFEETLLMSLKWTGAWNIGRSWFTELFPLCFLSPLFVFLRTWNLWVGFTPNQTSCLSSLPRTWPSTPRSWPTTLPGTVKRPSSLLAGRDPEWSTGVDYHSTACLYFHPSHIQSRPISFISYVIVCILLHRAWMAKIPITCYDHFPTSNSSFELYLVVPHQ